ncbi:hypothetical protein HMPREF9347_03516 [Escherichia coli MS 124-1]|nr:hypothetical protein HMPREF9347_03516 [Escherichia coli MS 124-1]
MTNSLWWCAVIWYLLMVLCSCHVFAGGVTYVLFILYGLLKSYELFSE